MPFVKGFLRIRRRRHRPGEPDIGLPDEEIDETPDWGLEEGERPEVEPPSPPGIWPPLEGPSFPIFPVDPDEGGGEGPWEPGEIWPPIRPPFLGGDRLPAPAPGQPLPKRLVFVAVYIHKYGFRWVVCDLNAIHRPELPELPARPEPKRA
jgi:hypothetical protein